MVVARNNTMAMNQPWLPADLKKSEVIWLALVATPYSTIPAILAAYAWQFLMETS
jgi:hypothetical protein